MTVRRWITLFVVVLVISLIWSMPASLMPTLIKTLTPQQYSGALLVINPSGRLWSGAASQVIIHVPESTAPQQIILDDVSWQMRPGALLTGRLCLRIRSADSQRNFDGAACVNRGGYLDVSDLVFSIPVADILPPQLQAMSKAIQVNGNLDGRVNDFRWHAGQVQTLQSQGLWSNASLSLALADPRSGRISRQLLSLGELPWRLQHLQQDEFQLVMDKADTLSDLSISVDSRVRLSGAYETDLRVSAAPSTPAFLRDLLRLMGSETEPGVYQISMRSP